MDELANAGDGKSGYGIELVLLVHFAETIRQHKSLFTERQHFTQFRPFRKLRNTNSRP